MEMPSFVPYKWRFFTGFNILRSRDEKLQDLIRYINHITIVTMKLFMTTINQSSDNLIKMLIEIAVAEAKKELEENNV